jgi:hypothetical protein
MVPSLAPRLLTLLWFLKSGRRERLEGIRVREKDIE